MLNGINKKKKFVDAVIAGKSNKDAAIAAGYSAATAAQAGKSRLVKDEDVSVYIAKRKNSGEQAEIIEQETPRFDLEGALLRLKTR